LAGVEQVGLVEDEHDGAATFVVLGGERLGCLLVEIWAAL